MTTQQTAPVIDLQVKQVAPFSALCFTTRTTLPSLSQYYGTIADSLYREAERLTLNVTGQIQWIYTGVNGAETNEFQLDIALPIHQPGQESEEFNYHVFGAFRCACHTHNGTWSELATVYNTLFPQFYQLGYQNDGRVREIYKLIDLHNLANCITEIQIAIA